MGAKEEIICFICRKPIELNEAEMIVGPSGKKVYVHTFHNGVKQEAQEEYKEE